MKILRTCAPCAPSPLSFWNLYRKPLFLYRFREIISKGAQRAQPRRNLISEGEAEP